MSTNVSHYYQFYILFIHETPAYGLDTVIKSYYALVYHLYKQHNYCYHGDVKERI